MDIDPHNIPDFIAATGWVKIESLPEYQLATEIATTIQAGAANIPCRFGAWYDQISRSSQSVLLNFAESLGRGKGWYSNSLMIARGELAETIASLSIGPPEYTHLKPRALELYRLISERIVRTPGK